MTGFVEGWLSIFSTLKFDLLTELSDYYMIKIWIKIKLLKQ